MVLRIILMALLATIIAGCSRPQPLDTLNLQQLTHMSSNTIRREVTGVNSFRYAAIQETALGMGARGGLAYRSIQINNMLDSQAKTLDLAFNFTGQLLAHNVLPPVLVEGRDSLNLDGDSAIRLSDRTYKIAQQARFVTAAPTWRNYLWMDYRRPTPPDRSLLPKNPREDVLWKHYIKLGWKQGMAQADTIYASNLDRLRRDYNGMLLYRKLLMQNMVSLPFVARTELGITSEAGEMRVNDQILRITALPQMQTNSKTWNPVIVKPWLPKDSEQTQQIRYEK